MMNLQVHLGGHAPGLQRFLGAALVAEGLLLFTERSLGLRACLGLRLSVPCRLHGRGAS